MQDLTAAPLMTPPKCSGGGRRRHLQRSDGGHRRAAAGARAGRALGAPPGFEPLAPADWPQAVPAPPGLAPGLARPDGALAASQALPHCLVLPKDLMLEVDSGSEPSTGFSPADGIGLSDGEGAASTWSTAEQPSPALQAASGLRAEAASYVPIAAAAPKCNIVIGTWKEEGLKSRAAPFNGWAAAARKVMLETAAHDFASGLVPWPLTAQPA